MKDLGEKLIKSIENGSVCGKMRNKISLQILSVFLGNRNSALYARQCMIYNKLRRRYKNIIDQGVEQSTQKKSNKVWVCWFQGYENAPDLVKACINSFKEIMRDKEIIILDESNISNYVNIPNYIIDLCKSGNIEAAHFSDILRTLLLCEHGGIWIDSTVLCTGKEFARYISEQPLFFYKQFEQISDDYHPIVGGSWLISAYSNNPILLMTKRLLLEYWKDYKYLKDYYLFHFFFSMSCYRYEELWDSVPSFNDDSPHTLQFEFGNEYDEERWNDIMKMSGFHKLNRHVNYACERSNYSKVLDIYLKD